jgi:hypothetical protein
MDLLQQHGFLCYMPEKLPVNDGGLCYGQLVEACALLTKQTRHQPADDSSSTNKQNNQPEHEAVP